MTKSISFVTILDDNNLSNHLTMQNDVRCLTGLLCQQSAMLHVAVIASFHLLLTCHKYVPGQLLPVSFSTFQMQTRSLRQRIVLPLRAVKLFTQLVQCLDKCENPLNYSLNGLNWFNSPFFAVVSLVHFKM